MMWRQIRTSYLFPILLFLVLYLVFYGFSQFTIAITSGGGMLYSPFAEEHLNWFASLRAFYLQAAAVVIRWFDFDATVYEPFQIKIKDGKGIWLVHSCVGTAIFSFWWAMILAFPQTVKNKIIFFVAGTLVIVVLNILRIAGVAMLINTAWGKAHRNFDHHSVFNIVVYGILFLMLYKWFNLKEKPSKENIHHTPKEVTHKSTAITR